MYFVTTVFQIGSIFSHAEHPIGHDFRGAQLVAPMDQINLRSKAGKEERFLGRGIAAADHADRHVAIKCAVAGRATR